MNDEVRYDGYATRKQCKHLIDEIYAMKRCCCRCQFFEESEPVTSSFHETASIITGKEQYSLEYSGFCHRFPPTNEEDCDIRHYPWVTKHDWCGEFVEIEKKLDADDVCATWLDEEDGE